MSGIKEGLCPECGMPYEGVRGHCVHCLLRCSMEPPSAGGDGEGHVFQGELPRVFGDYVLEDLIARGGMGVVFRARQVALNRVVAVKLLIGGVFAGPSALSRFRQEATVAAKLKHPHIVTVYEVGEHEELPFFSMEYIEGEDLAALTNGKPVSSRMAAEWMRSIADAVQHAHENGVLHRDLKPSNVIIDPFQQPRVTDFGLAQRLDLDARITVSGQALGSPSFMAPEQARGEKTGASVRSDLYALGAVLYQLLTGRPPFVGESIAAVLHQVEDRDPLPPRRLNPGVAQDLEVICLKCLEKDPGKRYASVRELSEELNRFLRGEPIRSRAISPAERTWRWAVRRPAIAGLLMALVLALAGGSVGVLYEWHRAELQKGEAVKQAARALRNEYSADMLTASYALERGDLAEGRRLLYRHASEELRGVEWFYLHHRTQGQNVAEWSGQTSTVCRVEFSPDGAWIAAAGMDGTLGIWDSATHLLRSRWTLGSVGWVLDFTPDGSRLLTSQSNGVVALRELASGRILREFPGTLASMARTGAWVVVSTASPWSFESGGEARLVNYETGETIWNISSSARAVAISPDGKWIAVGGDSKNVKVWERETRRLRYEFPTEQAAWCLRFSPDGRYLAGTEGSRSVILWDLRGANDSVRRSQTEDPAWTRRETRSVIDSTLEEGHSLKVWSIQFGPEGRTLYSTSSDRSIRVWELPGLEPIQILRGHGDEVWCNSLSPGGRTLATGGKDGKIMLWTPDVRSEPSSIPNQTWLSPCVSPDGRYLLTVEPRNDKIHTQLVDLGAAAHVVNSIDDYFVFSEFSSDGQKVLSLPADDGVLSVRSVPDLKPLPGVPLSLFPTNIAGVENGVGMSEGGRFCFVVFRDGQVVVWETQTGVRVHAFKTQWTSVARCALSRDGEWMGLSPNSPYGVALVNTRSGQERWLSGHTEYVKSLRFSSDSRWLATAGVDAKIKLWDVDSGRILQTLVGHMQEVSDVAFSEDGKTLASLEVGTELKMWRLDTFREVLSMSNARWGWHMRFCKQGRLLAVQRSDHKTEILRSDEH